MIAPNDTARAVNASALAVASGAAKPKRFSTLAQMTPNVPRWNWSLTDQLKGPGCRCWGLGCQCGGLGFFAGQVPYSQQSMGFFDIDQSYDPTGADPTGAFSVLGAIEVGANFIPGVGQVASSAMAIGTQAIQDFQRWFNIGAGRIEADAIVPTQNNLMSRLGIITNTFRVGQNPSLSDLQYSYREVWQLAVSFIEFVLQRQFTDRRASGQALNTVMPYIDGSCGYAVPLGATAYPTQFGCVQWGQGQLGGVGNNGMLGALERAITGIGGTVPAMPATVLEAANSGFRITTTPPGGNGDGGGGQTFMGLSGPLVIAGLAALYFYGRRARG
jgi:hypothetical protein